MNTSLGARRIVRTLAPALALAIGLAVSIAPAPSVASAASESTETASACAKTWGSLVKARATHTSKQITNVRSGRHRCFDRLAIDINSRGRGTPGFQVTYVARVTRDGSGARVPLRGGAKLRVIVKAPAYDDDGNATYRPDDRRELVDVAGYRTFRQVAWAGSFEGQTTIGLGVRSRLPMRAFVIDREGGGHTVVVDVAHRWP